MNKVNESDISDIKCIKVNERSDEKSFVRFSQRFLDIERNIRR